MNLIIFDVDGTLTTTSSMDEEILVAALKTMGIKITEVDFSAFEVVTDIGVFHQLFDEHFNRPPSSDEIQKFKKVFKQNLKKMFKKRLDEFEPLDGVQELLHSLNKKENWTYVLTTGGWKFDAKFKLDASGFYTKDFQILSSSSGFSREEILTKAIEKARKKAGVKKFERIVYFGDAAWDLKAAARLKLPFVGVEGEGNKAKRKALGDFFVLSEFPGFKKFAKIYQAAKIPQ